ncbi:RBBP9/YdeN family alpha/beta hydrolase [Rhizobium sp. YIM 134829]|uniref:RBBP9/YdeN family alpha/beta hydrolase n=1 Tax=Rhizobium sp. YIM 134829 TaxID=3390453 RepID=UPI0039788893
MVDTLILPGLNGSPPGHWQAHWAAEQPGARMLIQEDWACPRLEDWLARLEDALSGLDAVWLVAHSLGAILAANLADRLSAAKVKGALLVAPSDLDHVEALHPCIVRFGTMPTRRLPFPSVVVASRNDPYMPFDAARHYAQLWGSDLADLGHVGHINIASGFGRWSQGQALLDRLRASFRPPRPAISVPLGVIQSQSSPRSRLGS